ncbi:hypothetical protein SUGI_0962780 [Cryptomeria japonica]|nr:hypothetical protein SUGI_0962780 [Cryptomeria japonica]
MKQKREESNHPIRWEPRELRGHVGQNVHRVRHHQEYGLRAVLHYLRNDDLEQLHVPFNQRQPGLSFPLPGTRRDYADVRTGGDGIVATHHDLRPRQKGGGVLMQVQHFAPQLLRVHVYQG